MSHASSVLIFKGILLASTLSLNACSHIPSTAIPEISTDPDFKSEIVKSPIDKRLYKSIVLDNQLEMVLVSDPSIEKSAAALSVKVGSLQEPKEFGGLAHYLEHMLFLGTTRYPDVSEYSEFVNRHGGVQNAYTELDHTNFMVAVNNDAFDEALKRFSDFFYNATLDAHYADKERNAVHSEWTMKSPSDWVILEQLDGLTLNHQHPISQFNWGNLASLKDNDDTTLQDALVGFYHTYYSANLMKAAMVSNLPLSEMETLARKYFAQIPNKHTPQPIISEPVSTPSNQLKIIHYVPQADMKQLRLSFVIKNNADEFAVKPNTYINYLLTNEMPGSLAAVLRDAGLSESLYGSFDASHYGNAGSFNLYIDLTETGVKHRDRVMAAVIKYLKLLREKGVDKKYFSEIKQSLSNSFRFKEKIDDYSYAMQISADLQKVPTPYVLSSQYEYQRFNPHAIQQVLDQLVLANARVFYIDKDQPGDTNMAYFMGHYSVENISAETIAKWQAMGENFALSLPRTNDLMPENFDLVPSLYIDKPKEIVKQVGYSAFLGHSALFKQPKGRVVLELNSGLDKSSAHNEVLANLLGQGLRQRLTELQSEAGAAGMGLGVGMSNGLSFNTSGFSDKQGELLHQAIQQVLAFSMSEADLSNFKAAFKSAMASKKKEILLDQLFPQFSQLIMLDEFSDDALLAEVDHISVEEIADFKNQLLKQANLRVFAFGNYTEQQVINLADLILKELPAEPHISGVYESPRLHPQPGQIFNWQADLDLSDVGYVQAYISDRNDKDMATASLLSQFVQPALFEQIRTEEQLAYAVGFFSQVNKSQLYNAFYIQSSAKGLADVNQRMTDFRQHYAAELAAASDDDFNTIKNSELITLSQRPKNLDEEMNRFLGDWREQNYAYDSKERLISAVKQTTLQDLIEFYHKLEVGTSFGQVLIQMRGTSFTDVDFIKPSGAVTINDIDRFHQEQLP